MITAELPAHYLTTLILMIWLLSSSAGAQRAANHPYALDRPMPEPTLFGEGVVSTPEDDLNAAFTPDGQTVYFTRNFPGSKIGVILFSQYHNGKLKPPEIASFSGQFTDYDPIISPDGTDGTLYFSSNRPGGKGGFDLYRSRFVDGKYAEPENLGDSVNTSVNEVDSYVSPDQKFLVFAAYGRTDDLGGGSGDLYISFYESSSWSKSKNLGAKINSTAREYCPIGSPDGRYFFFTSFRGALDKPLDQPFKNYQEINAMLGRTLNGRGNVYQIDLRELGVR